MSFQLAATLLVLSVGQIAVLSISALNGKSASYREKLEYYSYYSSISMPPDIDVLSSFLGVMQRKSPDHNCKLPTMQNSLILSPFSHKMLHSRFSLQNAVRGVHLFGLLDQIFLQVVELRCAQRENGELCVLSCSALLMLLLYAEIQATLTKVRYDCQIIYAVSKNRHLEYNCSTEFEMLSKCSFIFQVPGSYIGDSKEALPAKKFGLWILIAVVLRRVSSIALPDHSYHNSNNTAPIQMMSVSDVRSPNTVNSGFWGDQTRLQDVQKFTIMDGVQYAMIIGLGRMLVQHVGSQDSPLKVPHIHTTQLYHGTCL